VILVAHDSAAASTACLEALRMQGVTRVVALHRAAAHTPTPSPTGNVGADLIVCVSGSGDRGEKDQLRRDLEAFFLLRARVVPSDAVVVPADTATLAADEESVSVSASMEYCVLYYVCDAVDAAATEQLLVVLLTSGFADGVAPSSSPPADQMAGASVVASPSSPVAAGPGSGHAESPKSVVDTLIAARWVIPMEPDEHVLLHYHAVVMDAGVIVSVMPIAEADALYAPRSRLERMSHVVLPGLINSHTHTGMTLMRGKGDDESLFKWLQDTVWPIEMAMLAAAEMLRGGVTTFCDMYWFPEAAARVAKQFGMRAVLGMIMIGFPSAYASNTEEYFSKGATMMENHANESRLHFAYAPHAPYTVPDETWERIRDLSASSGLRIHTHLHETGEECAASASLIKDSPCCHQSDQAMRPIANFHRMGLLSQRLIAAHMTQLTPEEIELCAEFRVNIAHCPTSNAKLASGFCPVPELLAAGVNVALGTDSAASNNSLDLFAEMKIAALLAKSVSGDPTVVPAATALRMATRNGAIALGIDDVTGSLVAGKAGDLICVAVGTHAGNSPVFDVRSCLVYATSRTDVTDVFVEGARLVKDGSLECVDEADLVRRAQSWADRINEKFPSAAAAVPQVFRP
jgi:5-methylthioadenosine/S-adenosylhomocysteine deaminase